MTGKRTTISNCRFAYKCAKTWDSLEESKTPDIKFCNDCQRNVYFCHDDSQLVEAIKMNHCVAFFRPIFGEDRFVPMSLGMPELTPLEDREGELKELIEKKEDIQGVLNSIYEDARALPHLIDFTGQNSAETAPDGKPREVWYRLAAEHGHVKSQYKLGQIYEGGNGVKQDYAEAAKWYRKAAEHYNYITADILDEFDRNDEDETSEV